MFQIELIEEDIIVMYEFRTDRGAMNFFSPFMSQGEKNKHACICAPASSENHPEPLKQRE